MWMTEVSSLKPGDVVWIHISFHRIASINFITEGVYSGKWEIVRTDGMIHVQKGGYKFLKLEDVQYDNRL